MKAIKMKDLTVELPDGAYFGKNCEGSIEIDFENYVPSTPYINPEDCGDVAEWEDANIFLVVETKDKEGNKIKKRIQLPDELFEYYRDEAIEIADEKCLDIYEGQIQSYLDSIEEKEQFKRHGLES